jgi:hypothetical protein
LSHGRRRNISEGVAIAVATGIAVWWRTISVPAAIERRRRRLDQRRRRSISESIPVTIPAGIAVWWRAASIAARISDSRRGRCLNRRQGSKPADEDRASAAQQEEGRTRSAQRRATRNYPISRHNDWHGCPPFQHYARCDWPTLRWNEKLPHTKNHDNTSTCAMSLFVNGFLMARTTMLWREFAATRKTGRRRSAGC